MTYKAYVCIGKILILEYTKAGGQNLTKKLMMKYLYKTLVYTTQTKSKGTIKSNDFSMKSCTLSI